MHLQFWYSSAQFLLFILCFFKIQIHELQMCMHRNNTNYVHFVQLESTLLVLIVSIASNAMICVPLMIFYELLWTDIDHWLFRERWSSLNWHSSNIASIAANLRFFNVFRRAAMAIYWSLLVLCTWWRLNWPPLKYLQ